MVEHNPPPPADSARVAVIPLPIALYVSEGLTFKLYDGGQPIVPSRLLKSQYGQDDLVLANHRSRSPTSAGQLL
jgi:hypothetical protein